VDTIGWLLLGLVALAASAATVRGSAWRRPRALAFIGVVVIIGLALGALVGLILYPVGLVSTVAVWVLVLAVIAFEAYRWRRRRARPPRDSFRGHS
jgi:hypothetical protein